VAQNRVQWRALVLTALNLGVLLPDITTLMEIARLGVGWNWLRIVLTDGLWY